MSMQQDEQGLPWPFYGVCDFEPSVPEPDGKVAVSASSSSDFSGFIRRPKKFQSLALESRPI